MNRTPSINEQITRSIEAMQEQPEIWNTSTASTLIGRIAYAYRIAEYSLDHDTIAERVAERLGGLSDQSGEALTDSISKAVIDDETRMERITEAMYEAASLALAEQIGEVIGSLTDPDTLVRVAITGHRGDGTTVLLTESTPLPVDAAVTWAQQYAGIPAVTATLHDDVRDFAWPLDSTATSTN